MQCLDDVSANLDILNSIGVTSGDLPVIAMKRCKGDHCKSDEEIDRFVALHRLLVLFNQQTFDSNLYGEEAVSSFITMQYFDLKVDNPNMVLIDLQK